MQTIVKGVLAIAIIAAISGGVVLAVRSMGDTAVEISLAAPDPSPTPGPVASSPAIELKVYISCAVHNPGVYTVSESSRLADVLNAAGGATDDANLSAVNLALRVRDEDHWHIPQAGEPAVTPVGPASGSVSSQPASIGPGQASGKINLNTASQQELMSLPNIGEVRAKAIISYREANGAFARIEDVLAVSGIGQATFQSIADLVEAR